MFGYRYKPRLWEDGYKHKTDRLNEDLSFRKQQHRDNKVTAQRQADVLNTLKRSIEDSKRAQVQNLLVYLEPHPPVQALRLIKELKQSLRMSLHIIEDGDSLKCQY